MQLREAVEHVLEIRPGATPVASLSLVMGRDMLPFTMQTQGADGRWTVIARVADTCLLYTSDAADEL